MDPAVSGTVQLMLDVDAEGQVGEARVVEGLHPLLDAAALEAARGLRFRPASLAGQPTAVRLPFAYHFHAPEIPKRAVLSGRVQAKGSRRPVTGARVELEDGTIGVDSDAEGHFTLSCPPERTRYGCVLPGTSRQRFSRRSRTVSDWRCATRSSH